jgi:glutathione S-transferase
MPPGIGGEVSLFVKNNCGFSRSVLLALANLHLEKRCPVQNITESAQSKAALMKLTGKETAPCLVVDQKPMHESKEIIRYLVNRIAPLPS